MTVAELFEHFVCYFEQIFYFDKTDNVSDKFIAEGDLTAAKNEEFLELYGDKSITEWEYNFNGNILSVEF